MIQIVVYKYQVACVVSTTTRAVVNKLEHEVEEGPSLVESKNTGCGEEAKTRNSS